MTKGSSNDNLSTHKSRHGMYNMSKEEVSLIKESIKRKEKYRVVREESILGLQDEKDTERHRSVARRILHNHEVAEAKANHAARLAVQKTTQSMMTLLACADVYKGFENEVAKMNEVIFQRLDSIAKAEQQEREKIERNKRRIEEARQAKENARKQKLKGCPFRFATLERSQRRQIDLKLNHSQGGLFTTQVSNLAYERAHWGKLALEQGMKNGIVGELELSRYNTERSGLKHLKPFINFISKASRGSFSSNSIAVSNLTQLP